MLIYTAVMIYPLAETLRLSFFDRTDAGVRFWVGLANFERLFFDDRWAEQFWNALKNNFYFFIVHMLVQNPIGILLAALLSMAHLPGRTFYRTAIFVPAMLSVVIIGFAWKLILSPIWGVSQTLLGLVGLDGLFAPWLGQESSALTTLALISVWQYVGIPMMLIYAALLSIPEDISEAANLDGVTGVSLFFKIKLPLILPALGTVGMLRLVETFKILDIPLSMLGGGPGSATQTYSYYTYQVGLKNFQMGYGSALAYVLVIVCIILSTIYSRRMRSRYQQTG